MYVNSRLYLEVMYCVPRAVLMDIHTLSQLSLARIISISISLHLFHYEKRAMPCHSIGIEVRGQLLPPCGSLGLNSQCQASHDKHFYLLSHFTCPVVPTLRRESRHRWHGFILPSHREVRLAFVPRQSGLRAHHSVFCNVLCIHL